MPRAKRRRECESYRWARNLRRSDTPTQASMSRFRADDEPLYGLGCQGSAVSLPRIVLAFLTRLLESMADCDSSKRANARRDRVPAKRVRTETALGLRVRFNLRFHLPAGDRRMHHTPI